MNCKTLFCLLGSVIFASPAMASVYKCIDPDGTTVYSQFPCQNTATEVIDVGLPEKIDAKVCSLAHDYGLEVAKRMRDGSTGGDEKAQLSGQFAGSIAAVNLIDYVHSFRNQPQMNTDRIADLTMAKCTNGGLGKISANDIPHRTPEEKQQDEQLAKQSMQEQALQISALAQAQATAPTPARTNTAPQENFKNFSAGACEDYRKKLQTVENAMRSGYTAAGGERLRQQNREFKKLIRTHCR